MGVDDSYRRLALQLHPDKNGAPGADEAFKSIDLVGAVLTSSGITSISSPLRSG